MSPATLADTPIDLQRGSITYVLFELPGKLFKSFPQRGIASEGVLSGADVIGQNIIEPILDTGVRFVDYGHAVSAVHEDKAYYTQLSIERNG